MKRKIEILPLRWAANQLRSLLKAPRGIWKTQRNVNSAHLTLRSQWQPLSLPENSALVGNNSMRLECVIYSFLGRFPPAFTALDSVKSASSFSWVHNAVGRSTPTFTPSPSSSLAPCCGQNSHRAEQWLRLVLTCPARSDVPIIGISAHLLTFMCEMLLLQELFVVWPYSSTGIKTPSQRRLSAGWKVWTVGLTVEDAGHLLFPLTFEMIWRQ